MNWTFGLIGIALLVLGLIGQGFEMRKTRLATYRDDELASPNIFTHKRNFKWYAIIGAGIVFWYVAERM